MMSDNQALLRLDVSQGGVYSKADLQSVLGDPHPVAFNRRVRALCREGVLKRFSRGWYVRHEFDLAVLSQRLAPQSYISFDTVLAKELIIGVKPVNRIIAVQTGRPRKYSCEQYSIEYVSTGEGLMFGFDNELGICWADKEKAILDTLYYHLRGRRYPFDIYSDLVLEKLDIQRIEDYLKRYNNPKFVSFAEGVLGIS